MPKEITHWHIGVEALKKSPPLHSKMKESERYEAAFLLGAVSHDSPYYADIFVSGADAVAEYLHGKEGEDTYRIVKDIFKAGRDTKVEDRYVYYYFSLGLLSHIILDAVLHPFIYYVTGDYYDNKRKGRSEARTSHRNIESILDFYVVKNIGTPYANHTIPLLLRKLGSASQLQLSKAAYLSCKDRPVNKKMKSDSYLDYWKYHSILSALFSGTVTGPCIRQCALLPKSIRALARAKREEQFYYIEAPFKFKDKSISMLSLCEEGKAKLSDVFLKCENFILGIEKNIPLKNEWGPSLNSGVPRQGSLGTEYQVIAELLKL